MKKITLNKVSIIIVLVVIIMFGVIKLMPVHAATNPNLGAAATFSVLAQTAITGTPTNISGNVGMNNISSSITGVAGAVVDGVIYATDAVPVAPGEAVINPAVQADASTAYGDIALLPIEGTPIAVSELNGLTRGPGVYDIPGNATLSGGILTLDGPGTYIFRTAPSSSLTAAGTINFINGARACDLFWNIGTQANIGGTSFAGTILASTGINFTNAGVALNGRALAVGADVTLNVNGSISGPTCPAPPTTSTLTLVKNIINDNGGAKTVADFPLTATGATTITGVSGTASVTTKIVNTGTYTLSETTQTGYTAGSWSCTNGITVNSSNQIILGSSDTTICTITNNDIAPQLKVTKTVINNNGGTKIFSDFPLYVGGTLVTSGVTNNFSAGTYLVTETNYTGYTQSFSGDCNSSGSITLALGEIKTCTITNDDIPPQLIVTNVVINDNGGNKTVSHFPLYVGGTLVTSGLSDAFTAGTYLITEITDTSYTQSFSGDCNSSGSITLALGEAKTCTITNNDINQSSGGGVSSGGGTVYGCKDIKALNYDAFVTNNPSLCKYTMVASVVMPKIIIPKLPKTGFPPQEPWYMIILSDFLNLIK